jgi:hypothetical protein
MARVLAWLSGAACVAACAVASPAAAEWRQATSSHFIVYGDTSETSLRATAERLERFDGVLRYFHAMPAKPAGEDEANKLTVYIVPSVGAVQRLYGKGGNDVAGFYFGRASGSVAFVPDKGMGDGDNGLQPQIVLFHEYAHHMLLTNYAIAYPSWFAEGYAEFASTTRFDKDKIWVGGAAQHRAYSLLLTRGLTVQQLFEADRRKLKAEDTESLYARGWLLTHYLMLDDTRRKAFQRFLVAFNKGTPSLEAAKAAFGDLGSLNRDLNAYLNRNTLPAVTIPMDKLPTPRVSVRLLTEGERALIPLRIRSDRGVGEKDAADVFARAAPLAARFPADATAQGWFAEMAYDAGKDDEAEAAADRALTHDQRSIQALIYKAKVHLRRAVTRKADVAGWTEARSWLLKANKVENDNAEALETYYDSFGMANVKPTKNAVDALYRAMELVPQDDNLRFRLARQTLIDGDVGTGRQVLRPLAYSPHASADNAAARLLALLDDGKSGPAAIAALEDGGNPAK